MNDNTNNANRRSSSAERPVFGLGLFFLGFTLVFLALMFLIDALGIVSVSFRAEYIIPLLVLLVGFSFIRIKSGTAFLVSVAVFAAIFGLLSFLMVYTGPEADVAEGRITFPAEEGVEEVDLNLMLGAIKLGVSSSEDEVAVSGTYRPEDFGIGTDARREGDTHVVDIAGGPEPDSFFGGSTPSMDLTLNRQIPFNINFEGGAGDINMALEDIVVRSVDIDAGASRISMALGNSIENGASVEIDAGASEIDITVPADIGVRITVSSGLTSRNFEGFTDEGENEFVSEGYEDAEKQITIDMDLGVSDVTVRRI